MARQSPPDVVVADCPTCEDETLHDVLNGKVGTRGEFVTLDATAKCGECGTTHHVTTREAKPIELAVILSNGPTSRPTKVEIPGDEEIATGEIHTVDGVNCILTGIESKEEKRVDAAAVRDVRTLWMTEFEERVVPFSVNMNRKTITKRFPAGVDQEFTVGEEHLFGRLRVTIHGIKTKSRMLKRGSATAGEIVRIFTKPTPLQRKEPRPEKHVREALREKEGHR